MHRVKVSLYGTKPPVWRRLENHSAMPLNLVHAALQIAFDWHGYLLHVFETVPALDSCRRRYGGRCQSGRGKVRQCGDAFCTLVITSRKTDG